VTACAAEHRHRAAGCAAAAGTASCSRSNCPARCVV
jgi:hypothetical protein